MVVFFRTTKIVDFSFNGKSKLWNPSEKQKNEHRAHGLNGEPRFKSENTDVDPFNPFHRCSHKKLYICKKSVFMSLPYHIGRYFVFLVRVFARPEKQKLYLRNILTEIWNLGIGSIGIVAIISVFIGAVITLQTAYNVTSPLFPLYLIGLGARDSMILEFSSTMVGLILAGKVGSSIAGEIGTMRVTEQIDALEIMGINPASFLVMPKVTAMLLISPSLNILSVFIGLFGGFLAVVSTGVIPVNDYLYGLQLSFIPFYAVYSIVKSVFFAFIITSVSAYQGYYVKGGSLEVGRAGTRAVVYSSVLILIFNLVLTQLLLA